MVNDILDYSQISTAKNLKLNQTQENIEESVQEVVTLIKFQAKKKNLKFIYNNMCRYREIYTDVLRLKQVILILLANSLKFTNSGSIELTLESSEYVGDDNKEAAKLKVSVKDTGIGIKEEDTPKLFKLFGTIEQKDFNKNEHGIGLGLVVGNSLAKHLNNSSEGGINLITTYGKGCFC
jgi:signal transduction histidine kinase